MTVAAAGARSIRPLAGGCSLWGNAALAAAVVWLVVGAVACAFLIWQYRRFDLRQRVALAQFASARLLDKRTSSVSAPRRRVKRVLFTLGVAVICGALARPPAGSEGQGTHSQGSLPVFATVH